MNNLQKAYIQNQILTMPMKVNNELIQKNKKFNKRSDYYNLINYIDKFIMGENLNRFLVLPGLRDVGKTTILYQVYEYLLMEKKINPTNILYFTCDRLKRTGDGDIFDVIHYFCETFHNSIIETLSQPVFILIDEAQYDKKWAFNGKLIYDGSKNIFMIFSGSSALKLSDNPDDAKRLLNIPIYPLTYSQHLKLKYGNFKNDISERIIKMIFNGETENSSEIEQRMINIYSNFKNYDVYEWKNFLQFGGFPSAFYQTTNDITKKIVHMVEKVVETDMNNINGINNDTEDLAFQILNFFAFQNPDEVSKGSLSNMFDAKKQTATKILDILEKTQLIFHIEAFTSSVKRTTKPNEYFFATSSIKHNLALDMGTAMREDETAYMGKLFETYVASSFQNLDNKNNMSYKTYFDDSKKKNKGKHVDFIVQRGLEKPIPIEVSFGEKDDIQIKNAIRQYNSPHGVIISNTTQNVVKKNNIVYIPCELFGFM